ncbi:uncharacterized protein C4orf17 homolog [Ciconia maguari]
MNQELYRTVVAKPKMASDHHISYQFFSVCKQQAKSLKNHSQGTNKKNKAHLTLFEHLASGDQRKSQLALQKDTSQENMKGYRTNTNFKSVYEPQFNHNTWKDNRCYSQSSCSGGKYYFSRNIPHPRMVCHIPGLNNALVCVVRSSFSREHPPAGNTVIPEQAADQEHVLTGNATSNTSANCYLPKLKGFMQSELGTSQSVTQGHADVPERIQNNPTSSEKLLKKQFQASAQPANRQGIHVTPLTQPSSPFVNLHYSPHIQENVNSDLSYLDHEIKVVEKLSKILQTDSLTEIQKWFTRASKKEKHFVSSLIYSEPTDKGVLNSKEGTTENMNSLSLLKPFPPLQRGPEGEINQSRAKSGFLRLFQLPKPTFASSTQSGQANNTGTPKKHNYHLFVSLLKHTEATKVSPKLAFSNCFPEREKEHLLLSTLRNRGPAQADTLFLGRTATEKVLWKQETVLPSHSIGSLTCATATPKQQISPFQWRLPYSEPLKCLPLTFTYRNM